MNLSDLSDFSRVAIIDDDLDEGNKIKNILDSMDIASIFYLIDDISRKAICLPVAPLKNIGLVFLDLKYAGLTSDDKNHVSVALNNLSRVVGNSGNYILVVWSANTTETLAEMFVERLYQQSLFGKPLVEPLLLDKIIDSDDLSSEIQKLLDQSPACSVFMESERLAWNAISSSIDSLLSESNEGKLSLLLNSLASAYGASDDSEPDKLMNALMVLNSLYADSIEEHFLGHDFSEIHLTHQDPLSEEIEKAKFNYSLMFSNDSSRSGSGAVFINDAQVCKSLKSLSLDIDKSVINKHEAGVYKNKIHIVDVDVTAVCDSAQKKNNRYLVSGILLPANIVNGDERINLPTKNGYEFPYSFLYDGRPYKLFIAPRTHRSRSYNEKREPILRLRTGILEDLQKQICAHLTRSGHTLFHL